MDPSEGWYFINFLDLGESSYGLAKTLERGVDCPEHAVFFDAVYGDDRAVPQRMPRAACLFEREAGDIAWRHRTGPDLIESRARRDLVLRMIATLGNYDYLLDWVFLQDGTIRVVAGATGIVNTRTVTSRNVMASAEAGSNGNGAAATADRADAYGRFVAEHMVAVNHDHFLSFRLDLDVDGAENSFVVDRLLPQQLPEGSPRRSIWVVESRMPRTEQEARLHMSMQAPALWRVINPARVGPLGYPVSYEIKPGKTAMSLLSADDNPQLRAGFAAYTLWVTRQDDRERMAVGDYPTGARVAGGLPVWTRANRGIENADIVVWYTMGLHHVARSEDWPVMPTSLHELELRPFDFFQRNPALDLPRR
jgi:primary-amine oxidase